MTVQCRAVHIVKVAFLCMANMYEVKLRALILHLSEDSPPSSVLTRNLFKGVHDEIHNIKKPVRPCLLKYFKWLLSYQRQRAGKGLILFSNQYTLKAQCPGKVRTLVYKYPISPMILNHMCIIVILIDS